MKTGMSKSDVIAIVAFSVPVVLILVCEFNKHPVPEPEPVEIQQIYYHADSLEALKWNRITYLDSLRRGRLDTVVVPYRKLFEKYADTLDLDWRLLAAIAYQESRFNLHAESGRGAVGLMQVKASTAERFGVRDLRDPEHNILAGALTIKDIIWRYMGCAPDRHERIRLTLAAYNAGPGKIHECIDSLRRMGISVHSWDDIKMHLDTLDNFKGQETTVFVERVEKIYRTFSGIE